MGFNLFEIFYCFYLYFFTLYPSKKFLSLIVYVTQTKGQDLYVEEEEQDQREVTWYTHMTTRWDGEQRIERKILLEIFWNLVTFPLSIVIPVTSSCLVLTTTYKIFLHN